MEQHAILSEKLEGRALIRRFSEDAARLQDARKQEDCVQHQQSSQDNVSNTQAEMNAQCRADTRSVELVSILARQPSADPLQRSCVTAAAVPRVTDDGSLDERPPPAMTSTLQKATESRFCMPGAYPSVPLPFPVTDDQPHKPVDPPRRFPPFGFSKFDPAKRNGTAAPKASGGPPDIPIPASRGGPPGIRIPASSRRLPPGLPIPASSRRPSPPPPPGLPIPVSSNGPGNVSNGTATTTTTFQTAPRYTASPKSPSRNTNEADKHTEKLPPQPTYPNFWGDNPPYKTRYAAEYSSTPSNPPPNPTLSPLTTRPNLDNDFKANNKNLAQLRQWWAAEQAEVRQGLELGAEGKSSGQTQSGSELFFYLNGQSTPEIPCADPARRLDDYSCPIVRDRPAYYPAHRYNASEYAAHEPKRHNADVHEAASLAQEKGTSMIWRPWVPVSELLQPPRPETPLRPSPLVGAESEDGVRECEQPTVECECRESGAGLEVVAAAVFDDVPLLHVKVEEGVEEQVKGEGEEDDWCKLDAEQIAEGMTDAEWELV